MKKQIARLILTAPLFIAICAVGAFFGGYLFLHFLAVIQREPILACGLLLGDAWLACGAAKYWATKQLEE